MSVDGSTFTATSSSSKYYSNLSHSINNYNLSIINFDVGFGTIYTLSWVL